MQTKNDFLARFALDDYPTFMPQDSAFWHVREDEAIPQNWKVCSLDITDEEWSKWEGVLYQPETKKKQSVFLANLKRPDLAYALSLSEATEEILPILIQRSAIRGALQLRVSVPDNSKVKVVLMEKFSSNDAEIAESAAENLLANISLDFELGAYSSLDVVYIHPIYEASNLGSYLRAKDMKVCMYHADVKQGAEFNWTSVNLGDSLLEKGEVVLHEEGAAGNVGGAAFVQDGSNQTYQSHIYCLKPHTFAKIHNHGVVEDGGIGTFVSISDIAKGAHGTEAREDNRFMTLGENAKAFVDPTLLIDEYDVKASHAATVGQVDENALYYLQSRGLTRQQAARLMTAGFLTPLFDRIQYAPLREQLLAIFYEKMHLDTVLGEAGNE